jgi:hypothetical protein
VRVRVPPPALNGFSPHRFRARPSRGLAKELSGTAARGSAEWILPKLNCAPASVRRCSADIEPDFDLFL